MRMSTNKNDGRLQAKRNVELWIYSFADMYMILSVFFIALSVIYAAKIKEQHAPVAIPSAGRGTASVVSELQLDFERGSAELGAETIENMTLLLPALKQVKGGFIDVEGYADGGALKKGSGFSSNMDLSNRRAVRVAEWLIRNGVSARHIRTFSYGDAHLWRASEVGSNRRVVVKVAAAPGSDK